MTPGLVTLSGEIALVCGICLFAIGIVAGLLAYRVIGRRIQPDEAMEWLIRWEELRPLERWNLLQAYLRMDLLARESFRTIYSQLGCQVFREFTGVQGLVLGLGGDHWLRREVMLAHRPPPVLLRPLVLMVPMTHQERPVSVIQVWAFHRWGKFLFGGLVAVAIGAALLVFPGKWGV